MIVACLLEQDVLGNFGFLADHPTIRKKQTALFSRVKKERQPWITMRSKP